MDCVYVTFLVTGDELKYIVPSFPVNKPILKEVKLQWEEANGTIHVFDGFACLAICWITSKLLGCANLSNTRII